jgi:hypothetical protein
MALADRSVGAPVTVPAAAVVWIAGHADELVNGQAVRAQKLVLEYSLHAGWR